MNKTIKIILFALGIIFSVILLNGIVWALVVNLNLLFLAYLGGFLFIIIPLGVFIFLMTKKKLSENQRILKSASIWALIIMTFFRVISLFY
jgi:hypothetical protein